VGYAETDEAVRRERKTRNGGSSHLRWRGTGIWPSSVAERRALVLGSIPQQAGARSRRLTIGRHGKVAADSARKDALRIFDAVRAGQDPVAERRAYIDAPAVNDLLDRYIAEHVEKRNRPRTRAEIKRLVERHIRPQLGRHKVGAVTRQDVAKLHRGLEATPRQANFVLAVCSKAFSLAEVWSMRSEGTNPCTKVERNPENARERFLSPDELGRLGTTLRQAESAGLPWKIGPPRPSSKHQAWEPSLALLARHDRSDWAPAVHGLPALGSAESSLGSDRLRDGYDQAVGDEGWPAQVVVINAPARQVLQELRKAKAFDWVLPSTSDAKRPLSPTAIEAAWQRIRIAAELEDVRLHDLRHTVGTYAGQSGANAFLVRDLLRHKNLAMTGRYVNRADSPVRTLSDYVGERIAAAMAGHPAAEVVSLKPIKAV
jgi:hypothetical protein